MRVCVWMYKALLCRHFPLYSFSAKFMCSRYLCGAAVGRYNATADTHIPSILGRKKQPAIRIPYANAFLNA